MGFLLFSSACQLHTGLTCIAHPFAAPGQGAGAACLTATVFLATLEIFLFQTLSDAIAVEHGELLPALHPHQLFLRTGKFVVCKKCLRKDLHSAYSCDYCFYECVRASYYLAAIGSRLGLECGWGEGRVVSVKLRERVWACRRFVSVRHESAVMPGGGSLTVTDCVQCEECVAKEKKAAAPDTRESSTPPPKSEASALNFSIWDTLRLGLEMARPHARLIALALATIFVTTTAQMLIPKSALLPPLCLLTLTLCAVITERSWTRW